MLDKANTNYKIVSSLPAGTKIINAANPIVLMKAKKNPIELENIRRCHIRDAVAMTKFMYWLKTRVGKEKITEMSAADKLLKFRQEQDLFIEPIQTASAYKEHAALMHYMSTPQTDAELQPEGMLLVDSGGQYYEGTTDITRTFVLGEISEECRYHFTSALRSMIALAKARFLYGCRGMNLDILARGPIWDMDLDYQCGTGHGIGHVLNVHEARTASDGRSCRREMTAVYWKKEWCRAMNQAYIWKGNTESGMKTRQWYAKEKRMNTDSSCI